MVIQPRVRPKSHAQVHDLEAHVLYVEAYPDLVPSVPVFFLDKQARYSFGLILLPLVVGLIAYSVCLHLRLVLLDLIW